MMSDIGALLPWVLAGGSLVLLLALLVTGGKGRVEERLEDLSHGPMVPPSRFGLPTPEPVAVPAGLRVGPSRVDQLATRRLSERKRADDFKERMMQAGLYKPATVGVFQIVRIGLMVGPAALGLLLARLGHLPLAQGVLFGLMAGIMGTLAPGLWLDHAKRVRQKQIRRALPDALDVMAICLEGGLSLTGAISRVANELGTAHPLLAVEMKIVERQTQMGRTSGEALRELARRFDLEELRSMASVVIQAEKIGSSVATALEVFAETLRQRRYQRAEELGHQAAVKILFPTVFFIFPALFIVILGPAAIQIYVHLIQSGVLRGGGGP